MTWELEDSSFRMHKGNAIGHCTFRFRDENGTCLYQYGPDGGLFMVRPMGYRGYSVDVSDCAFYKEAHLTEDDMAKAWNL
jgi:hypothetical protein